ncbi:MAG: CBS domain-containing protein [Candidatus Aenigmarchaeota archaeon]|nr:CBS domain-containing protein [Candidatus Aenigmarchaeota archaeon]
MELLNQIVDIGKPVIYYSNTNPEFVNYNNSIYEVIEKISKTGYRRFPVLKIKKFPIKKNNVLGVVTVMDILDAFLRNVDFNSPISLIMSRDIITCRYYEPLEIVIKRFKFARRGGFPVVDDKMNLKGLVTEHDIVDLFKDYVSHIHVKDIMTRKPFYISQNNFYNCLNSIINTKYRKLPIVENKKLCGLITDRLCLDILKKCKYQKDNLHFSVSDIMIKKILTINEESDVKDAIELMKNSRCGGLIVTDDDILKGIITERDILDRVL